MELLRMEVIQVNLHHSMAATSNLIGVIGNNNIDVALIQEPWIDAQGKLQGLKCKDYVLFYKSGTVRQRTCILANKNLKIFLLDSYSDEDNTVVRWERNKTDKPLVLISSYMPYDSGNQPPSNTLRRVVDSWREDMLIGCDANAHHTQWGSTDINSRGESLLDYIGSTNLSICNRGIAPTFITRNRKEVLDLTLATNSSSLTVRNWRVSDEASLSDHCWIRYQVDCEREKRSVIRNPRKADWVRYKEVLDASLMTPAKECLMKGKVIDRVVDDIGILLTDAFDTSCPISRTSNGGKPPWWNVNVEECRKSARLLHNKAKRLNTTADWDNYKEDISTR